jgi:hypothetical protein
MTYLTKLLRLGSGFLALTLVLGLGLAKAQEQSAEKTPKTRVSQGGRDPFRKYEPPRVVVKKSNIISPPSIEARISQYRAQKQAAMIARIPAPKPVTALLLSEVQVVGISRTPRGYAAIVEALPIKMSFVIYPGERFYDGQLVAIEDSRLVFRRETVFTDGRRDRSVEMKPLRQPTTVDAFAASKPVPPLAPTVETAKSADKPVSAQKP